MRAFFLELRAALGVDQAGGRIGKFAPRIALRRLALRLDEDRPAGAEAAQRVVEPRGDRDELGRRRANPDRARETAPCAGTSRPC